MNKTISKAMVRSRWKNEYMKNMSEENKRNYTWQRNYYKKTSEEREYKNVFANSANRSLVSINRVLNE